MAEIAGFLSVLAMSFGEDGDSLKFLMENREKDVG